MTSEEISRAREICNAATPGPWIVEFQKPFGYGGAVCSRQSIHTSEHGPQGPIEICRQPHWTKHDGDKPFDNANFIAEARTLLPKCLDEIERLNQQIVARQALDEAEKIASGK